MDLNYVEPGATVSPEETAERSTAALRAMPGIIDSVSAGQMANAPPNLAIASTAARIHLWNSTYGIRLLATSAARSA